MRGEVVQNRSGYKALFVEKEYLIFMLAKLISRFGDSLDAVAYGWLVFKLTGSATMLATLYAVNGIPSILFNFISGVVVTYLPKKKVIYICDIGRGLVVFFTGILFINGMLKPWHLFLFTFINSTFEAFREPADSVFFTQIVSKEKMEHAVSMNSTVVTFIELIGYSIAGTLIALVGTGGIILIDGITFLISGVLIIFIKVAREVLKKEKLTMNQYFIDLKDGTKYIFNSKFILSICIFAGIFNLFLIPFNSLMPAYVDSVLQKGPNAISIMSISILIAMIVGSSIVPKLKSLISGFKMFIISGMTIGICYALLSQLHRFNGSSVVYIPLIIICVLMGGAIPMMSVPVKLALVSRIDKEYLPRSIAFVNSLSLSATPLGGGIVGMLVGFIVLRKVYLVFSIAVIILFIIQFYNNSMKEL